MPSASLPSDPRYADMLALRASGLTMAAIGARYGISRERVRQIIGNHGRVGPRDLTGQTHHRTTKLADASGVSFPPERPKSTPPSPGAPALDGGGVGGPIEIAEVLSGSRQWCVTHGDCLSILPSIAWADHMITDPPYSAHTHAKQWIGAALTSEGAPRVKTAHKSLGFDALAPEVAAAVAAESKRSVRRWSLVFTDIEGIGLWRECVMMAGLDYVRTCIWDKVDGAPQFTGDRPAAGAEGIVCAHPPGKKRWNGGGRRNVFRADVLRHAVNAERGAKPHPSTKPLPLMMELVELFTDEGDVILDPFCGSGSTLVAALRLGRRAIGVEMDRQWVDVAIARCSDPAASMRDLRAGQSSLEFP